MGRTACNLEGIGRREGLQEKARPKAKGINGLEFSV